MDYFELYVILTFSKINSTKKNKKSENENTSRLQKMLCDEFIFGFLIY
jgi:hypothetical protein